MSEDDPWRQLALHVLVRAFRDNGASGMRSDVSTFLDSGWFRVLCDVAGVRVPESERYRQRALYAGSVIQVS